MQSTQIQVTESVTSPADVMRGAAAYLRRNGWIRADLYLGSGSAPKACMDGAIMLTCYGSREAWESKQHELFGPVVDAYFAARAELKEYLATFMGGQTIWYYNNVAWRTADEVVQVLDAAADWSARRAGGAA